MAVKMRASNVAISGSVKEPQGYIYLLRNLANGKGYVGQTIVHPEKKRWYEHIYIAQVEKRKHPLYAAIRKYGVEGFSAEVVHQCGVSELNKAESQFIEALSTFIETGCGYNLTLGGDTPRRAKCVSSKLSSSLRKMFAENPAVKIKMSLAATKRWQDPSNRLAESHRAALQWRDPVVVAKACRSQKLRWLKASERTKASASAIRRHARERAEKVGEAT